MPDDSVTHDFHFKFQIKTIYVNTISLALSFILSLSFLISSLSHSLLTIMAIHEMLFKIMSLTLQLVPGTGSGSDSDSSSSSTATIPAL